MGAISESGVAEDRDNRLRRDSPPGKQVPTHTGASKGAEHYCRLLSWVLLITVGTALWWSRSLHMQACAPVGTASVRPARDPATVSYMASKFLVQAPKVLCFGDSLTERGFGERGWVAGLAQHFVRRADIINVGLGGYNSRWALQIVQDVLAGHTGNTTALVTLWFGANDAALPNGPSAPQHVPVAEYSANLAKIVEAVRAVGIKHIVILTPPPVHDAGRKAWQVVKHGEADAAGMTLDRTLEFAQQYARAAVEAGKRLNIPVVELYDSMQQDKDWGERYLCDGLHFTPEGNQFVLSKLVETLDAAFPDLRPEALPIHYPPWDMVDAKNPAATFGICAQLRQQGPGATSTLPSNQQL